MKCAHRRCELEARTRGLCARHYKSLMRQQDPPRLRRPPKEKSLVEERAADGANTACVDCWEPPLYGGMRCLPCFQTRAAERSGRTART